MNEFDEVSPKDAAKILRGLDEGVTDLSQRSNQEGQLNLIASAVDEFGVDDSVSMSTDSSPTLSYDTEGDEYGFGYYE